MKGGKEASYDLPGKTVRACVASGLHNHPLLLHQAEALPDVGEVSLA